MSATASNVIMAMNVGDMEPFDPAAFLMEVSSLPSSSTGVSPTGEESIGAFVGACVPRLVFGDLVVALLDGFLGFLSDGLLVGDFIGVVVRAFSGDNVGGGVNSCGLDVVL